MDTATVELDDSAIRSAALAADRGEAPAAVETQPSTTEADTSTSQESETQPGEQGSDEHQQTESETGEPQKATQKSEAKPDAKKPAEKPDSPFIKAQKEKARLDGSWKKLQAEKEQNRREIEAEKLKLKQEREEWERQRTQRTAEATKPKGPGADAYENLARTYEEEGNPAMAKLAREKAAELRAEAQQQQAADTQKATQTPVQPYEDPKFKEAWNGHVAELVAKHPHLNDPANLEGQATMGLINHPNYGRFFRAHPDGIKIAHEVALLQRDAAQAKVLTTELTKAKAEVDRLTKLTSLRGAPPPSGAPGAGKPAGELSGEAAEDFVRNAALKADRGEST